MSWYGYYSQPIPSVNERLTQPETYDVISAPATTPISLAEAKSYMRVLTDSQDVEITLMIESSVNEFERLTGRTLISTGFRLLYALFTQAKEIRKSKLISLDSFQYSVDGTFQDVPAGTYYNTFETLYSRIIFQEYVNIPLDKDDTFQSIRVDFTAGYGSNATDVPADIRLALLQMVTWFYESRGDCAPCSCDEAALPPLAREVINKYKIKSLYGASYRG